MKKRRKLQEILDSLLDEFPPPPPKETPAPWSDEQTKLLISHYLDGLTDLELAEVTGRKLNEVQERLFQLGRGRAVPLHLRPPPWWFESPWRDIPWKSQWRFASIAWREEVGEVWDHLVYQRQPLCDGALRGRDRGHSIGKHWYSGEIDAIPDIKVPSQKMEAELKAQDALYREERERSKSRRDARRWRGMYPDSTAEEPGDQKAEWNVDPNATLKMIDDFLKDHHTGDQVDVWCLDLWDWIKKGGFEPDWAQYELGASYYHCRKMHHDDH